MTDLLLQPTGNPSQYEVIEDGKSSAGSVCSTRSETIGSRGSGRLTSPSVPARSGCMASRRKKPPCRRSPTAGTAHAPANRRQIVWRTVATRARHLRRLPPTSAPTHFDGLEARNGKHQHKREPSRWRLCVGNLTRPLQTVHGWLQHRSVCRGRDAGQKGAVADSRWPRPYHLTDSLTVNRNLRSQAPGAPPAAAGRLASAVSCSAGTGNGGGHLPG
jgi:hypothetical protein